MELRDSLRVPRKCVGNSNNAASGPASIFKWERISNSSLEEEENVWWLSTFKKLREWLELVAGPRWKTFIWQFNKSRGSCCGMWNGKLFQYDPLSYASISTLELCTGGELSDFSSRYVAIPVSTKLSMDLGRDAPVFWRARSLFLSVANMGRGVFLPRAANGTAVAVQQPRTDNLLDWVANDSLDCSNASVMRGPGPAAGGDLAAVASNSLPLRALLLKFPQLIHPRGTLPLCRSNPKVPLESCHTVLAFIVPVLLNLLQIKYQGNQLSPFDTYPISMVISVASLLLYCFGYHAKSRWPTYALAVSRVMVVFGSLSVVSLASSLFPDSFGPVLYTLFVLFSAAELLMQFKWVHRKVMGMLPSQLTIAAFSNTGGVPAAV
ncbi:hypothetical protein RHSIM_Rhsim07G0111700 [Rhododendron simsii]|uniref:Uncharacterized protein n=1 Tax=Rhododendron simsii TaxID=118357 RepID=A0A834LFP7_RHOSS|nr:hypothetical protein RHSIM_Rhsim07G0111700 [Rhododendron simsii]